MSVPWSPFLFAFSHDDEWTDFDEKQHVVVLDSRSFDEWAASLPARDCPIHGLPMTQGDGEEWFGDGASGQAQGYEMVWWCPYEESPDDEIGCDHLETDELVTHGWIP